MSRARSRIIALVALLAAAGGVGVWLTAKRTQSTPVNAAAGEVSFRSPEERIATLENSLRAVEDGLGDAPRDWWDPAYVVEVLGNDPARLLTWVRENTDWIPYRGVLRGPAGVLMDRTGNSLDRALLLATLLEKAGHVVRLAHGQLSSEQAFKLLPDLVARQAAPKLGALDTLSPAVVDAGPVHYGIDAAAFERMEDSLTAEVSRLFEELHARAPDQTERLLHGVKRPDPDSDWSSPYGRALDALQDHWWVQWSDGSTWQDLDLLAPARMRQAEQLKDWANQQANLKLLPWYPEAPSTPPSAPVPSGGAPGGALQTGTVGVAGTLRGFPPPPP